MRHIERPLIIVKINNELFRGKSLLELVGEQLQGTLQIRGNDQVARKNIQNAAVIGGGTIEEPVNGALDKTPQGGQPKHQCQQIQGNQEGVIRPNRLPDEQGKRRNQTVKYQQYHPGSQRIGQNISQQAVHIQQAIAQNGIRNGEREQD